MEWILSIAQRRNVTCLALRGAMLVLIGLGFYMSLHWLMYLGVLGLLGLSRYAPICTSKDATNEVAQKHFMASPER